MQERGGGSGMRGRGPEVGGVEEEERESRMLRVEMGGRRSVGTYGPPKRNDKIAGGELWNSMERGANRGGEKLTAAEDFNANPAREVECRDGAMGGRMARWQGAKKRGDGWRAGVGETG